MSLSDQLRYAKEVQAIIDRLIECAEEAENANRHALSAWFGSVCKWVREREKEGRGFTVTLPDPDEAGDPLTVIEVASIGAPDPSVGASP